MSYPTFAREPMSWSQLYPFAPGTRGEWGVMTPSGYEERVTGSHQEETGIIYVHVGASILLEGAIQAAETPFEAMRRMVADWQSK